VRFCTGAMSADNIPEKDEVSGADGRFVLICHSCRYDYRHVCAKTITFHGEKYKCDCYRCRLY